MCKISFQQYLKTKNILSIIVFHLAIMALICVLIFISFPCPFKFIFGIPCPACGTLHALHAIICGNLYEYMRHNYLAIPMVMAFWFGMHKKILFKNSVFIDVFIYVVCTLVVIKYFLKLFVDFL